MTDFSLKEFKESLEKLIIEHERIAEETEQTDRDEFNYAVTVIVGLQMAFESLEFHELKSQANEMRH